LGVSNKKKETWKYSGNSGRDLKRSQVFSKKKGEAGSKKVDIEEKCCLMGGTASSQISGEWK